MTPRISAQPLSGGRGKEKLINPLVGPISVDVTLFLLELNVQVLKCLLRVLGQFPDHQAAMKSGSGP